MSPLLPSAVSASLTASTYTVGPTFTPQVTAPVWTGTHTPFGEKGDSDFTASSITVAIQTTPDEETATNFFQADDRDTSPLSRKHRRGETDEQSRDRESWSTWWEGFKPYALTFGGGGAALFLTGVAVLELMSYNKDGRTNAAAWACNLSPWGKSVGGSLKSSSYRRLESRRVDPEDLESAKELLDMDSTAHRVESSSNISSSATLAPLPQAHLAVGSLPPTIQPLSYV